MSAQPFDHFRSKSHKNLVGIPQNRKRKDNSQPYMRIDEQIRIERELNERKKKVEMSKNLITILFKNEGDKDKKVTKSRELHAVRSNNQSSQGLGNSGAAGSKAEGINSEP